MTIDVLHATDVASALALSDAEGWNKLAADWTRITRLEPAGCFAARDGDRLIGTVTTTTYGGTMAWIGMMIVHPEFRRQGIGAALMRRALDYLHGLGIASVKLDATPAGRPLYESLGFTAEAEMERWQGNPRPLASLGAAPARRELRETLLALDQTAFRADRSRLLDQLLSECVCDPILVHSEHGAPAGYALARRGLTATYIGPMIASSASMAAELLDGMLARVGGADVCLDLHRSGWLEPAVLTERGLSKRRGLTRMRYGQPNDAGTARSIATSAGPEFG